VNGLGNAYYMVVVDVTTQGEDAMEKTLLWVVVFVSWCGYALAQQTTGKAAEESRRQVMQFEKEKVPLLIKGGAAFADWLQKMDAADIIYMTPNGHRNDKPAQVEMWRSGHMTQSSNFQHDHETFVYNNGNVVIVTYVGTTVDTVNGVASVDITRCADTWVKDGDRWLRVVHANVGMAKDPRESSAGSD